MVKIGPVVLEKKMLTDDARRTPHDDGRQPIATGHQSDSGDLKIKAIHDKIYITSFRMVYWVFN